MKNFTITLLFVFLTLNVSAQFPAPTNFEFNIRYIPMLEIGYCKSKVLNGPNYCFISSFTAPDLGSTTSTLVYYKLYKDNTCVDTIYYTYEEGVYGTTGEFYVTAIYVNPAGESAPSNKILIEGLPINLKDIKKYEKITLNLNFEKSEIYLITSNEYTKYKIISIDGKILNSGTIKAKIIPYPKNTRGLYIIELTGDKNLIYRGKVSLN